ncbi:hypothetical protein BKA64DRAFT_757536 [Cadophora sp. MPI-SDFR-AT-0126]|nr:hypothetical protein BKA64DRAFT_757536 [Leotiomycetes sp. MPI-SDFR-AT-0126]
MEKFQCDWGSPSHARIPTRQMLKASTEDPPEFHPFKELPLELQDVIWERALPGPRIVYLQAKRITIWGTWDKKLRDREGELNGTVHDRIFSPWDFKPADAERVKKLALYDGLEVQRPGVVRVSAMEREWYSFWIHRNVLPEFKDLKSLVTVDRQHCEKSRNCKDLVMMDRVLDVKAALYYYWQSDARIKHARYNTEVERRHQYLEDEVQYCAPLRKSHLEHFLKSGYAGPKDPYVIPEILEARPMTTRERVEEYETAKIWFAKLREGYYVYVTVKKQGHPTRLFTCARNVTFGNIADCYRKHVGIDDEVILQGGLVHGDWGDWESLRNTRPYVLGCDREAEISFYLDVTSTT